MRLRTVVILLLLAGAGYWLYRTHTTVSDFVDSLTSPLMRSKAAVKESEHKRVVAEAVPAPEGEEAPSMTTLKEGMKTSEVKDLLGAPEKAETIKEKGRERVRWTYVRIGRVVDFEDGRVVSITVR